MRTEVRAPDQLVRLHDGQHRDEDGQPRPVYLSDLAECGTCFQTWCHTCHPTPSARCPFEYEHEEEDRPTLADVIAKIERWEGNLRANADHYERDGRGHMARAPRVRARDLRDVLEMLREIDQ